MTTLAIFVHADAVGLALLTPLADSFEVWSLKKRVANEETPLLHLPFEGTLLGQVISEKRVINTPNISQMTTADSEYMAQQGVRSRICAPLTIGEWIVGTFNVGSKQPNQYDEHDEEILLQAASFLGAAIKNVRLYTAAHKARVAAEAATLAKSEFLANMSHELRNPYEWGDRHDQLAAGYRVKPGAA